ncbi:hypothetical protein Xoosp14_175 [Xanthomonas phage Xoo-sp14]|nr:hypothetical protein Xoosp14_175 [Xanthomonas phage Xoo-sp14]
MSEMNLLDMNQAVASNAIALVCAVTKRVAGNSASNRIDGQTITDSSLALVVGGKLQNKLAPVSSKEG